MDADRDRPPTVSSQPATGLPSPAAMAGVVQPRGRDGVEIRCLVCGQLFTATRRDRRTCSPRCGRIDAATRRKSRGTPGNRRCAHCGRRLVGGRSDRRYCDVRCRMRAYRRRLRDRAADE